MSEENDKDLERTQELYDLLQGKVPKGCLIPKDEVPKLTPEQAWTVIWYLGNQYWQVTDRVEKCDVCGQLYHTWQEGECMDFGNPPYSFCGSCVDGDEARTKRRIGVRLERAKNRSRAREQLAIHPPFTGARSVAAVSNHPPQVSGARPVSQP